MKQTLPETTEQEALKLAWEAWLARYLVLMTKGAEEPVLAGIAATQRATEYFKPVFEAGFHAGATR